MNKKHRKTLEAIFAKPVSATLPFRDVESFMRAVGFEVKERDRELREALEQIGIKP